ncbi:MAG: D-alanyl-D-alanine carboxypeptidase/D-alanyl-D-alanine-endopeptidase [Thermaerobacter sp.]|nr:D-alanyl-D-alanine carboxypeptidase/D-alanyl-D-alanine-endopeptidase [Thermaerobacter sp.]
MPRWNWPIVSLLVAAGVLAVPVSAGSVASDNLGVSPVPAAHRTSAAAAPSLAQTPKTSLQNSWLDIVATSPALQHAAVSAYAYDLTTHRPLAALSPQQMQIPASVMKMFTTAAALAELGPNFSYKTRVEVPASVVAGQPGPIYLVGGGDPWLEANGSQGLEQLAAEVARRIPQATQVIGVSSLFTRPGAGPAWSASELEDSFASATSALVAERSEVEVVVTAGSMPGAPVRIGLQFNSKLADPGYFQIRDEATTVASHAPGATITRLLGTNTIVVQGSMLPHAQTATTLSVHDPALFAAALFQEALSQRGVQLQAPASTGSLPQGMQQVAVLSSHPLSYLLPLQNRFSINLMADNLYRMLGAARSGVGSPQTAQAAMAAFSQSAGFGGAPPQADGSGLSPLNERSATQIVSLLTYAASQPWYPVFEQSMMQAGSPNPKVCGVICGHFVGTPAAGRVWLKTGNLENQWNYAGYATAANGDNIAFAILVEGPLTNQLDGFGSSLSPIDQMTVDLATWPKEPPSTQQQPTQPPAAPPAVAAILHGLPGAAGALMGGTVIDLRSGRVVWQQNGATLIRAAWVPRIALLDAALGGGTTAFKPVTVRAGGPLQGGTVAGPIILDGNNNPDLSNGDLATLAQAVRTAGVTTIAGPVEYVQGPIAGKGALRWPSGAVYEALGQAYLPPASRLTADGDQVTLTISASAAGARATTAVSPQDAPISVIDRAIGAPSGTHAAPVVEWQRGTDAYIVTGEVPIGEPVVVHIAPPNPGQLAATMFRDALRSAGVHVEIATVSAAAPDGQAALLASLPGSSLAQISRTLLASPSTGTATQVDILLGNGAVKALQAVAGPTDIVPDPTGTAMNDYMTAESVAQMLAQAWGRPAEQPLVAALGTQGLWHATTPGTEAFVGYFKGPNGTPYAAAILQSGLQAGGSFAPVITPPSTAP